MTKNTLLPDDYQDPVTQTGIIYALKEYENPGTDGAINPHIKWNLHKAWEKAKELLPRTHWQDYHGDSSEYELAADNDDEITRLNNIIAGIVACQIMNPEEKIAIRHIRYKKGGEVSLIISASVGALLKRKFPLLSLSGKSRPEEENGGNGKKRDFLDCIKIWRKKRKS